MSLKIEHTNFCFASEPWKCIEGYKFVPGEMFSGIKRDCFRVLLDPRSKYRIAMTHSILKGNFCDVISLKVQN